MSPPSRNPTLQESQIQESEIISVPPSIWGFAGISGACQCAVELTDSSALETWLPWIFAEIKKGFPVLRDVLLRMECA
ncbi:hypothetical protein CEXT_646511 [Caerostris extrusa]|uniref:Uncharacterized protein n=1 Tax=Caerostris extrusa TaxID=172846 RepID=A0AAV4MB24_CAEEX|nr:hypothetical protein CEXT_646511 [Caerostris extrusa]